MMGLAVNNIDDIVLPEKRKDWPEVNRKWFCENSKCKIPGLMKAEKRTDCGSFIALSPKCYLLGKRFCGWPRLNIYSGEERNYKRSTKGIPGTIQLIYEDFRQALYENFDCYKTYSKLQFNKKLGTMCLQRQRKRALNACYTKMFTDNVLCTSFDAKE